MSVLSQFATIQGGALETTGSSNITLTVSSAKLQAVNMTATALSVTLPAATTLKKGGPLYIIKNTGSYIFTVLDGSAGLLITMYPNQSATFSLANNSATAGVWVVGAHKTESSINPYIPTIVHVGTGSAYNVCAMSQTQSLLVMAGTSARTLNLSGTAFSLGTELVTSLGALYSCMVKLTSTKALYVWSAHVIDKYVLHSAVITISGTICTIGSTVLCSEGSGSPYITLARLTDTTAVATQGTDAYVITVSDTVPSYGAKQASLISSVSGSSLAPISSTSVLATYGTNRKVLSISGNTVTAPGSTITRAGNYHSSGVLSSSLALTAMGETTGYNSVIEQVSISGTTLTSAGVYAVTGNIIPTGAVGSQSSVAALSSTQALVLGSYTGTALAGSVCTLVTLVAGFCRVSTPMAVLPEVGGSNTSYQSIVPLSATRAMVFIPSSAGLYGNIVDVI